MTKTDTDTNQQWTPSGRSLTDALPGLVDQVAGDGFEVFRVMFNPADWDDAPRRVIVGSRLVKLGWFRTQEAGTVTVTDGSGRRRITLDVKTGD